MLITYVNTIVLGSSPALPTRALSIKTPEEGAGQEGEEQEGEVGEEEEEGGESDKDEDICPICLNELDEGEDLLICRRCNNHLHQHCMDICKLGVIYGQHSPDRRPCHLSRTPPFMLRDRPPLHKCHNSIPQWWLL